MPDPEPVESVQPSPTWEAYRAATHALAVWHKRRHEALRLLADFGTARALRTVPVWVEQITGVLSEPVPGPSSDSATDTVWETDKTRTDWAVRYEYGLAGDLLAPKASGEEARRDAAKPLLGPHRMTAVSRVVQHRISAWTSDTEPARVATCPRCGSDRPDTHHGVPGERGALCGNPFHAPFRGPMDRGEGDRDGEGDAGKTEGRGLTSSAVPRPTDGPATPARPPSSHPSDLAVVWGMEALLDTPADAGPDTLAPCFHEVVTMSCRECLAPIRNVTGPNEWRHVDEGCWHVHDPAPSAAAASGWAEAQRFRDELIKSASTVRELLHALELVQPRRPTPYGPEDRHVG